jgi:oligosaccharide repeat unit polymerase
MFKNPAIIFAFVWIITIGLYLQYYATVLEPLKSKTIVFVLLSIIFFTLPFFLLLLLKLKKQQDFYLNENLNIQIRVLFFIWLFFSVIEILLFRYFPLFSVGNVGQRYSEWGIHGLHGALNSIILVISNMLFYKFLVLRKKRFLILFVLCLLWPVLLLTRQVLMSMIIQSGLIYMYKVKIKTTDILKYFIICMIIIFLFGLLGDIRSGNGNIERVAGIADSNIEALPSGVFWIYAYFTTPLNNFNHNIEIYPAFDFKPIVAFGGLLPSVIRPEKANDEFSLVTEALNVSTMHPQYVEGFGLLGSLFFYFTFGTFVVYVYVKYRTRSNAKWLFMLVVITYGLVVSIFTDYLLRTVFVFQFILHYYLGTNFKSGKIINYKK